MTPAKFSHRVMGGGSGASAMLQKIAISARDHGAGIA
jgi:hypothetical protein